MNDEPQTIQLVDEEGLAHPVEIAGIKRTTYGKIMPEMPEDPSFNTCLSCE